MHIKVCIVKAMGFPVAMYGCESWTIKKAECRRIDAFELWCWRRLLRLPWTERKSNQSIRKEISPEYSLEGLMLKLKLQYFGHLMQRTDSLEKPWCWESLKAGGEGDNRGWDGWMASSTHWTWVWASSGSWWWTGKPGVLWSMGSQRVRHDWATKHSIRSVQSSRSVVSDSLRPRGLQHARPPCPSPTPRAYSNSCLSCWWCHPTISSSVIPFSSCTQSFPATGSFQMSQLFA